MPPTSLNQNTAPEPTASLRSGPVYLWFAVILFAASNAIVRKLTDLGAQNLVNGHNPISPCNVLFVSNLCALLVLVPVYYRQITWSALKALSPRQWVALVLVAAISGALAPALIFQALTLTMVSNVVLVGRIEPPVLLLLSVWLLKERPNRWEILGTMVSTVGVVLTVALQGPGAGGSGFSLGWGEILTLLGVLAGVVGRVLTKVRLKDVPLGLFTTVRMTISTVVFFGLAIALYGPNHFGEAFSPFLWQWMLLYGSVIVAVGQLLWFQGLRQTTTAQALLINSFSPVAGIGAAALILQEQPQVAHYVGGGVIVVGLLLSQYGTTRQAATRRSPPAAIATMQHMEAEVGFKGGT